MNDKCSNCGSDLENMGDGKQICWCCGYLTWIGEVTLEVVGNEEVAK